SLYSRSQRKANHALELMRAHLEDLVSERTAALEDSNRKLNKENEWRSQAEALLKRLTMADPITELPNRVGFIAAFARDRDRMLRTHTMIVISIENFRDISESEGCSVADVIMRQAAALLVEAYPDPSVTARWDDSHFVILTSAPDKGQTNGSTLPEILIRLKATLEHTLALGSYSYSLKTLICATPLSLAWAELDPLEKIILWSSAHFRTMRTDPAIEWAILDSVPEQTANGIRLQQRLREALDEREFLLHFQPIISGPMDAVIGCEALIRWRDSKSDRLVMPM
ncbi:MAG: diguanylate cyclase, partial [Leptospiraceae bacterium]|nr:diguanylate cyclase [Leptospiraceae bacterium]